MSTPADALALDDELAAAIAAMRHERRPGTGNEWALAKARERVDAAHQRLRESRR